MLAPRWQKVWRDVRHQPTRTALVVVSIAIGVFAFGSIIAGLIVTQRELRAAFVGTNPASGVITTTGFDEGLVDAVANLPEVAAAQGRRAVAAVVMLDATAWHIETEDLSELDVVHLAVGDAVEVTFDALPELTLPGVVRAINAQGTNRQGDIVYTAVVDLSQSDAHLRWNMTATVVKP